MNGTRALRDRLEETQAELRRAREHLEKLKAHQARERDALQQQVEQARREVSGLKSHLEALEIFGAVPVPPSVDAAAEPVAGERSATALVALARSPELTPATLTRLSKLLGLSPVDVRLRVSAALPAVLVRLPLAQAEELRAALRAEGFLSVLHEVAPLGMRSWAAVKRFAFEEQELRVESQQRKSHAVRYTDLRLLVRGRKTTTQIETKQEHDYETHHMHAHRVVRTVEEKHHRVENFLWVMGRGFRAIFNPSTQFLSLGAQRSFSVHENLQRLMAELQRRAPHLVLDERFLQQSRFVMPLVDPDRSQELLAEVLFQAVEERLWS